MAKALRRRCGKVTTSKLATGTHTIEATYNEGTNFNTSSATLTQTVN